MTTKATITASGSDGWFNLISPYDDGFLIDFKEEVPAGGRKWDKARSIWVIRKEWLHIVKNLAEEYFDEVIVTPDADPKVKPPPKKPRAPRLSTAVPLNPFLPLFEVVKREGVNIDKLYKALAQTVHPDHGGDSVLMVQLNAAYEQSKVKAK